MPIHSYFVLIAFTVLFIVFAVQFIRLGNSGTEFMGNPTIEKLYFYSGKIAIFTTWALFIVKAISPRLGYIYLPSGLSWLAVGLLYLGVIIVSISFINLGKSNKKILIFIPRDAGNSSAYLIIYFNQNFGIQWQQ